MSIDPTPLVPLGDSSHSRNDDVTLQRSSCARFVQFISNGCNYIRNGLASLIHRIRDCFCRNRTPEQLPIPPLSPDRFDTLNSPVPIIPLPPSTTSAQESAASSSSTSASQTPEETQPVPTLAPQTVSSASELPLPSTTSSLSSTTSLPSIPIPQVEEVTVAKTIVTQFCNFVVKIYDAQKKHIRCLVERQIPLRVTGNTQKLQSALEGEKRAIWDQAICSHAEYLYPLHDNMNQQELNTILNKQSEFIANEREKLETREEYIAKEIERSLPLQRHYQNQVISQQGLRLFSCLSLKDQLFMLKKLQSAGLVSTLRIFVSKMSDAIQEKITTRFDNLKKDALDALAKGEIDQNIIGTKRKEMEAELVKYWKNQPAIYSTAWDEIIQSTLLNEMQILAAQEPPLPDSVHFVQQIIYNTLNHEAIDNHLTSFDGFSLKDQLWIIENLIGLTGNQYAMPIIPPACIVLLVNKLPQKTREAMSTYLSDKQDLFVDHQVKPALTLEDIYKYIYPAILISAE